MNDSLVESLGRYVGQTVTIFTESGGMSGCGFTGTLAGIFGCNVRLITCIGAPPACPIGSSCCGGDNWGNWGFGNSNNSNGCSNGCNSGCNNNNNGLWNGNWLGSVCDIPINKIVCFTHTAI